MLNHQRVDFSRHRLATSNLILSPCAGLRFFVRHSLVVLHRAALDYSCLILDHFAQYAVHFYEHDTQYSSMVQNVVKCKSFKSSLDQLLYTTFTLLCATLRYPSQDHCARSVTIFYHSIWSTCLFSFHLHTILRYITLLYTIYFTLYPAFLYTTYSARLSIIDSCNTLRHFALLFTLHSTPFCVQLNVFPPKARCRSSRLQ